MTELIIGAIVVGVVFVVMLQKSNEELRKRKEEERRAMEEAREFKVSERDTDRHEGLADEKNERIEYLKQSPLNISCEIGHEIATMLTDDKNASRGITAEISLFLFMIQDSMQQSLGVEREIREANLINIVNLYSLYLNMVFGWDEEESGRLFDERQATYAEAINRNKGTTESFLKDAERYLAEIIASLISKGEPSRHVLYPESIRDSSPVCTDLILRHRISEAIYTVLGNRFNDFIGAVRNQ